MNLIRFITEIFIRSPLLHVPYHSSYDQVVTSLTFVQFTLASSSLYLTYPTYLAGNPRSGMMIER